MGETAPYGVVPLLPLEFLWTPFETNLFAPAFPRLNPGCHYPKICPKECGANQNVPCVEKPLGLWKLLVSPKLVENVPANGPSWGN